MYMSWIQVAEEMVALGRVDQIALGNLSSVERGYAILRARVLLVKIMALKRIHGTMSDADEKLGKQFMELESVMKCSTLIG